MECPCSVLANPAFPSSGCRFHRRCGYTVERCAQAEPDLVDMGTAIWRAACARRSWIWPEVELTVGYDAGIFRTQFFAEHP